MVSERLWGQITYTDAPRHFSTCVREDGTGAITEGIASDVFLTLMGDKENAAPHGRRAVRQHQFL